MEAIDLTDEQLTVRLEEAVRAEAECSADVLFHLGEFDRRDLWKSLGHGSLYRYCIDRLLYNPSGAMKRIQCARTAVRFPQILGMLREQATTLDAISILSPHLNQSNFESLLREARTKTRVELEFIVAALAPRPGAERDVVRPLSPACAPPAAQSASLLALDAADSAPQTKASAMGSPPAVPPAEPPLRIDPFSEDRVRVGMTISKKTYDALQRIKGLLWHKKPSSRLEDALEEAADFYLQKKDPARKAARKKATRRGRAPVHALIESRRIPQWVKDEVWTRDGGRCACLTADGSRCPETTGLEYDHIVPWALGGRSQDPKNIRLACRAHNQQLARQVFGPIAAKRRSATGPADQNGGGSGGAAGGTGRGESSG